MNNRERLRYRFNYRYVDRAGDLQVGSLYAETAAVAETRARRRMRFLELDPRWEAVMYPNGEVVLRCMHEQAEVSLAGAKMVSKIFETVLEGAE